MSYEIPKLDVTEVVRQYNNSEIPLSRAVSTLINDFRMDEETSLTTAPQRAAEALDLPLSDIVTKMCSEYDDLSYYMAKAHLMLEKAKHC